jgi:hypothetical protein
MNVGICLPAFTERRCRRSMSGSAPVKRGGGLSAHCVTYTGLRSRPDISRFLIFGSFVTTKEMPGDVDVVLVMGETFKLEEAPRESRTLFSHADADARFGASVFWIRRGILPDEEVARLLEFWQSRRDGETRGIVEVTHDQK